MAKKIKKAQLEKVVKQQEEIKELLIQIGGVASQKHAMLHKLGNLNEAVEETKKELEAEYGSVNIDLTNGTYTPIEKESGI
tara:strand:- start:151 stop:393 length:243 start_codon:yes stop_codon:yes gene_type:complete